ncbi:hypothetical protein AAF712_012011 [Marasmius tenuissimus]|uniref:Uncharacterized protein n=1 Tax=Marasmius tenuissimus TaxID=585030 RepID=A0ABR2ZHN4_9AGAR
MNDIWTPGLAVPIENKQTTKTDDRADKCQRPGAGPGAELEGMEGREQQLDQALECTTLSTLNAERLSLPSISDADFCSDNTSLNIVLPTPSFPTQFAGLVATSHSKTDGDDFVDLSIAYTDPNISSIGSNTTSGNSESSITDTPKDAGWSATSQSTINNALCDDLASNMASAVSYSPNPTTHAPPNSTSSIDSASEYVSLTHRHDGGSPTIAPRRFWIPQPFVSNVKPITHLSLWPPVSATVRPPTRSEDNRWGDDGNEDLD